ncbi:TAXI family TRAP transporter solute-binding subunit [Desulfofundulus sp. TPOSR]|uniref:TAXI family TRAP transporter solute-binding subunit n=1 Tax=Desulfofundulus sp. TPOSR TaxID=2714340 RepID=UPI00140C93F1|nr:TAXI family TRAP transporter solute-binding subunit [Desulfofundulus sp. TPOSR]NHM28612.1 TAXI family TRAP transporter solute-binding subunit [Desulfofundulus sp. TPOSR]
MLKLGLKKNIALLATLVFLMGILTGCTGSKEQTGQDSSKVLNMSISTGATSGTYYPLGTAIASVVSNAGIGVNMTAESTSGSIENARLIGQKQTEIGFVESLIADWAYNGKEMFKDQKVENIRGLVALYPNTIQTVVKKKSGIKSYKDLKGKKVAVGIQGSSSPMAMQVVLESYGLSMNDIKPQYLAYGPSMELLKDDQVDAVMVDAGAPNSSIIDVSTQHDIDILSIEPENIRKIREKYPYFSNPVTIPKGTYKGVDKDIITTGSLATLCVRADLPEDVVYNITKTIFEKRDEIAKVHEKGKSINLDTAINGISIPLHPGAERYYKEMGVLK